MKATECLRTLLVTKGGNAVNITDGRIAIDKRCVYGFMSLECRTTPIIPCQELKCIAPCRMKYGLDVAEISPAIIQCLENTHWEMVKAIQGLS